MGGGCGGRKGRTLQNFFFCDNRRRLLSGERRKKKVLRAEGSGGGRIGLAPFFCAPRPSPEPARSPDVAAAPPPLPHGRSLSVKSFRRNQWLSAQRRQVLARAQRVRPPAPRQTALPDQQIKPSGGGREPECCRPASAGCSSSFCAGLNFAKWTFCEIRIQSDQKAP